MIEKVIYSEKRECGIYNLGGGRVDIILSCTPLTHDGETIYECEQIETTTDHEYRGYVDAMVRAKYDKGKEVQILRETLLYLADKYEIEEELPELKEYCDFVTHAKELARKIR